MAQTVKNLPAIQETWVQSLEKEWLPTPVFLPGEFHGQQSLAGYSLWGYKELDTTEWLTLSLLSPKYITDNETRSGSATISVQFAVLWLMASEVR